MLEASRISACWPKDDHKKEAMYNSSNCCMELNREKTH